MGGSSSQPAKGCAADDRVVQAIAHTSLPLYGVQFHPESIGTAFGRQLLHNFAAMTAHWHGLPRLPSLPSASGRSYFACQSLSFGEALAQSKLLGP